MDAVQHPVPGLILAACLLAGVGGAWDAADVDRLIQQVAEAPDPAGAAEPAREAARSLADPAAAVDGLRRLAMTLAERGAPELSLEILGEARDLADRHPDIGSVDLLLLDESEGRVLLGAGRNREALPLLERALAERRRRDEPAAAASDLTHIASASFFLGEYERSAAASHEALRLADGVEAPAIEARALFQLGFIHRQLEQYDEALELFRASAAAAERAGDPTQVLRALNEEANVLYFLGRTEEAVERKRLAIAAAEAAGDAFGLATFRHDMGVLLHGRQRHEQALAAYRKAHESFLGLGSLREAAVSASNVSAVLLALDRASEALAWSERAVEIAREGELPAVEETTLYGLAAAAAAAGDHRRAFETLHEAYVIGRETMRADTAETVDNLQARFEAERRQAELEHDRVVRELQLTREQTVRRFWFVAFLAAATILTLVANRYRLKTRAHREISRVNVALEAARARLAELARTDGLTQLANRREADSRLQREALRFDRSGHGFSVLLIDIDRFKRVNDEHGHEVGDRVLRHLADLLRESTRALDVPARWGGEEFLVVLPGTDLDGARVVASAIRTRLAATPCLIDSRPLPVTVTIGVARYRGQGVQACIRRADEALYAGKAAGRDRIVSETDLESRSA